MKNSVLLILFACVLVVAFALGATGIVAFAKNEVENNTGKDRLIGVWITTGYLDLFDFESYLNDNAGKLLSGGEISEQESASYQGRLYAKLGEETYVDSETGESSKTPKYVFEGKKGISFFAARYTDERGTYWGSVGEEAVSDSHVGFHSTDAGDSIDLKGTIYVSTTKGCDAFYYNPVYQTDSGEVYTTAGQGVSYAGELVADMATTHTMNEEETVTVNEKSETISTNVEVSVTYMDTPIETNIIQLDEKSGVLSTQKYAPGELPESIEVEAGTAYVIVETKLASTDGKESVSRELFQREDESLFAFFCREDGICIKQYCSIIWQMKD